MILLFIIFSLSAANKSIFWHESYELYELLLIIYWRARIVFVNKKVFEYEIANITKVKKLSNIKTIKKHHIKRES